MAKGRKRSNRELKKPKQLKPKMTSAPNSSIVQTVTDAFTRGKKR